MISQWRNHSLFVAFHDLRHGSGHWYDRPRPLRTFRWLPVTFHGFVSWPYRVGWWDVFLVQMGCSQTWWDVVFFGRAKLFFCEHLSHVLCVCVCVFFCGCVVRIHIYIYLFIDILLSLTYLYIDIHIYIYIYIFIFAWITSQKTKEGYINQRNQQKSTQRGSNFHPVHQRPTCANRNTEVLRSHGMILLHPKISHCFSLISMLLWLKQVWKLSSQILTTF